MNNRTKNILKYIILNNLKHIRLICNGRLTFFLNNGWTLLEVQEIIDDFIKESSGTITVNNKGGF